MDQAPAPTEKVEQTSPEQAVASAPNAQAPTAQAPASRKDAPPTGPIPDRSFRLNLSSQAHAALTRGKLMDDATRAKLKAQEDAKAARDERKSSQEKKRQKIEAGKRRAIESDKLLDAAINRLVETDSTRASAHREGQRLIEQADQRVAESKRQVELAHEALTRAHKTHADALFEYGRVKAAAQEARVKWSPDHADVSYNDARTSAQAAILENELAWREVSTKFRKEKRNRALRRTAREMGLVVEGERPEHHNAEPESIESDTETEFEPELAVEGTFVVPGAVEALMDERKAMQDLADFQKAGASEDNAAP